MDVKVRDKKSMVEKTIPLKTYELLRHKYILLSEGIETAAPVKKNEVKPDVTLAEVETPNPETAVEATDAVTITESVETIDDLLATFELLSGNKPDKRWGVPRLKSEIEKLKTN